jgi:SAM-dependent methyltransferase
MITTEKSEKYRAYWEANIEKWGNLYLDISHGHEEFKGPKALGFIYNRTLVPWEAHLMKTRYQQTMDFLKTSLHQEALLSDVGCGTGVFTVMALQAGARVNAIDFSSSALNATRALVEKTSPALASRVTYHHLDLRTDELPKSDVALMVGVLPYIADAEATMTRVLSSTQKILVQYVDRNSPSNLIRRALPILNVRSLNFHSREQIESLASRLGFRRTSCEKLGTGYMDQFVRS